MYPASIKSSGISLLIADKSIITRGTLLPPMLPAEIVDLQV